MKKKHFLKVLTMMIVIMISFFFIQKEEVKATYTNKDSEMRAVWVTPWGGDANLITYTTEAKFKENMNYIFAVMEEYNLNTIIYHIRTHNAAYYKSTLNPKASLWSNVDFDTFDPLAWVIEESHKRGIEFHAWLNPYRLSSSSSATKEGIAAEYTNFPLNAASNPDNILISTAGAILNPGKQEVRDFIVDTVVEIMDNYDIDAIHFDDYFYANMGANGATSGTNTIINEEDQITYEAYIDSNPNCGYSKTSATDKANWRRSQVDAFIEQLSNTMRTYNQENNRYVQLGIAPTGIYKNGNGTVTYDANGNAVTTGSATGGQTHYSSYLFCDTVKWCNEEWIDYILPQSYWATNHPTASYYEVMGWWDKVVKYKNVNLYSGLGLYMADESSNTRNWQTDPDELLNQLTYITTLENCDGASFYNFNTLRKGYDGSSSMSATQTQNLGKTFWDREVVQPEIKSMTKVTLGKVNNFNANNNTLTWDKLPNAKFYAIYRSATDLTFSSSELVDIVGGSSETFSWTDSDTGNYEYGIRALSYTNTLGEPTTLPQGLEDYIKITGAQIRKVGNEGLRFIGSVETSSISEVIKEYGIAVAFGEASVSSDFVVGGTVNSKEVLSTTVGKLDENGNYYVTLYNVPEDSYLQKVTARSYVVLEDNSVVYSSTVTTKSLGEVALKAINNNETSVLLENIKSNIVTNYKKTSYDANGNYVIDSVYEYNYEKLGEEFLADYNKTVSSSLTSFAQPAFYNDSRSKSGATAATCYDISDSKIYAFFNDENMKAKWGWLLQFLIDKDNTVHSSRQGVAIQGNGQNGTYALYYGNHFIYSLTNFFTKAHLVNGYTAMNFENGALYSFIPEYNNKIFVDANQYNIVKVGESVILPDALTAPEGYVWDGWYIDSTKYNASSNYVVTSNNVVFTPTFKEKTHSPIGSVNIIGYNSQNAFGTVEQYHGIRLYKTGTTPPSSLNWYRVTLSYNSEEDTYTVNGIALAGVASSTLPAYDYMIMVWNGDTTGGYTSMTGLGIQVGDRVEFSENITNLTNGSVTITSTFLRSVE